MRWIDFQAMRDPVGGRAVTGRWRRVARFVT